MASKVLIFKILGGFIFPLLIGIIFGGCMSETPAPSEDSASPTVQLDQVISQETSPDNTASTPVSEPTTSPSTEENTAPTLIIIASDVTTLEPYRMVTIHPDGSIASHLWDTLTRLNDDLQVEPHLAESWRLLNDLTWEFKLRQGISFHNGELLNAEAVRFSVERAQSMADSLETFAEDVGLEQVEIVDDYTLRLITRQPIANLSYHLAFLEILPPVYYAETSPDQLAIAPVGSGPYRLSKWTQGRELVLEAVPDYWQGVPALSHLVFQVVPNAEDRLAALRLGKAVLVTDLPPVPADQWAIPDSKLVTIESTQRMFVGLRIEAASPLADKRVRQALNYGVNVQQIVDSWLAGYGKRYSSWVNPPANNPELPPWPYDPDMARKLLSEAGYEQGFTATLRLPTGVYYQDVNVARTIAQQLGDIGVMVEVETVDWTPYMRQLLGGDTSPLFLLGLNSRGDGLEDTKNLSKDFAFNPTGWQNGSFEDTLKQASSAFNENARARLLNQAQAIAYDEAPWIWLWRRYDFYGVNDALDWTPRRDGLVTLYKSTKTSTEK